MSGRGDIRMYVEHLFEGRTLDAETIELKEEIYGNLTARFDDYVAQGMSEAEAFSRTCEAVMSVDDVLGGDGEKNAEAAGGAGEAAVGEKDGAGADAEATRVAPVAAPVPPGAEGASQPQGGRSRWSTGKVVGVVAAVIVAAVAIVTVVNVLNSAAASVAYDEGTVDVQAVDATGGSGEDVTYMDGGTGAGSGTNATTGSGTGQGTTLAGLTLSTDGIAQEISGHDASAFAAGATTSWPLDGTAVANLAGGLPLAGYLMSTGTDSNSRDGNVVIVEYEWVEDDRLARTDDDAVEQALAYNAAALLCAANSADAVRVVTHETDAEDGELSVDTLTFSRADLEGDLATSLTADRLTDGTWDDLRAQLSTEHYYDRICDRADRD